MEQNQAANCQNHRPFECFPADPLVSVGDGWTCLAAKRLYSFHDKWALKVLK